MSQSINIKLIKVPGGEVEVTRQASWHESICDGMKAQVYGASSTRHLVSIALHKKSPSSAQSTCTTLMYYLYIKVVHFRMMLRTDCAGQADTGPACTSLSVG